MPEDVPQLPHSFPWAYCLAAFSPLLLIAGIEVLPWLVGPMEAMGWQALCAMAIAPTSALIAGWGAVRLSRGDGKKSPALRWLVAVPVLIVLLGLILG